MTTQEIVTKMQELMEIVATKQASKTKKDHNLARKASSELKKLAGEFKKTSAAEDKAVK